MNKQAVQTVGQTFPVTSVLGIAFVVLKLCGVINWSWWWVLSPFWIPAAVGLSIAAVCLIVAGILLTASVVLSLKK